MRAAVVWSAHAHRNLRDAVSYLRERSPRAATHFAAAVSRKIGRLARFPESGRKVPEFPDARPVLRELIIGNYRLVYTFQRRRIEILTLFHGRREFKKVFSAKP